MKKRLITSFIISILVLISIVGCETSGEAMNNRINCRDDSCDRNIREEIGFLGCSITHNAVDGYHAVGGKSIWSLENNPTSNYGGGCLSAWVKQLDEGPLLDQKDYWKIFEYNIAANPNTEKIWFELCSCEQVEELVYEDALRVIDRIKEIAPGKEIYATAMPRFLDTTDGKCMSGIKETQKFVGKMVQEGKVSKGPLLSRMPGELTTPDGCHVTKEGQAVWGQDLIDFFDEEPPLPPSTDVPYSYFVVHIKRGADLDYAKEFIYLKDLVESADSYNVKLTLQFSPQWVDYLLKNNDKKNLVKLWQKNGHEISIIHPGPSHLSWDGYSNMPAEEAINISYIRGTSSDDIHELLGTMDDFLEMANELAYPEKIKSGTITDKWEDVPAILYITDGIGQRNRKAVKQTWNGNSVYLTGIGGLWTSSMLESSKVDYESLTEDDIFGVVAHHHNFEGSGKIAIEAWFEYLSDKDPNGEKRKTVTETMEEYVLPNNLVIEDDTCGDSLCDDIERATSSCSRDCRRCTFPSDCVWCTDSRACPECKDMRVCEQGTESIFYEFMFGSNDRITR